ncbi:MAG: excisionase family DNA-binding protein [Firmicutes bacterium]|nr:excisionase family DNA-binding protein [Candidatus Caballimonas caccae]
MDKPYTLKEVAVMINLKYRSMFKLVKEGKIKAVKMGKSYVVYESEVNYIKENGLRL